MSATLLNAGQIWDAEALGVIKAYGTRTAASDLAIVLGQYMASDSVEATSDDLRPGFAFSASPIEAGYVRVVDYSGDQYWDYPYRRERGARPALPSSVTSLIPPNEVRPGRNIGTVQTVEYGEYPQTIAGDEVAKILEAGFKAHTLARTGKHYTFDAEPRDAYDNPFKPQNFDEYVLDGVKYIRVNASPRDSDSVLSNGHKLVAGEACWIKVEPIEWLKDPSGWWVSHKTLFAGVKYSDEKKYDGNFGKTNMAKYLKEYFWAQMQASRDPLRVATVQSVDPSTAAAKVRRKRDHGIDIGLEAMSIKEQIQFYVQKGKTFMLHGPSGIGKTARVEQADEDLTAVPLWNGVLPEDIVGKVIYPNGKVVPLLEPDKKGDMAREIPIAAGGVWVPPDWYNEAMAKCKAEPDKMHVVLIDEVTNAKPVTQSLIFHIALKKSISPSKGKLPDNCVVVLAGNSKEESGAAHNMPNPLFRRMNGHIYLTPNIPDWLEYGAWPDKRHPDTGRLNVHPLVAQFVAAHGMQVFYSHYDEDNPGNWAIDPRGWKQVSDIIQDNRDPETGRMTVRRELIANKIGNEMAASLVAFMANPPLSLEEVLDGEFDASDIPTSSDAKLALALSLRGVDDRNVGKIYDFIGEHLGSEKQAVFASTWAGEDDVRTLRIAQLNERGKGEAMEKQVQNGRGR